MQLDENPYLHTEESAPPAQPTYPQPEQPYQQSYQQPYQQQPYQLPYQQSYQQQSYQQPYQQQTYQQPYQQQPYQQYPYQQPYQPYPQQNVYRAQPDRGAGMAKAFSIVSFITGIVSLFMAMSVFLTLLSVSSPSVDSLIAPCIMLAVPGLAFGIIALIKKTRLLPMALIGVIMNGVMVAATLFGYAFEYIL